MLLAGGLMLGLVAEAFALPPCDSTEPSNKNPIMACRSDGDCINGSFMYNADCSYTQWNWDYTMCDCSFVVSKVIKCGSKSPPVVIYGLKTTMTGGRCSAGTCYGAEPYNTVADWTYYKVAVPCDPPLP